MTFRVRRFTDHGDRLWADKTGGQALATPDLPDHNPTSTRPTGDGLMPIVHAPRLGAPHDPPATGGAS